MSIHTKSKLLIIISLVIIAATVQYIPASALTYSDATNVQFTFNSSLSVSVSGDLYIDELAPGSSSDSNIITVDVATNNISGYNLSATTGSISNATTNLTHTNNTNIFSSLDTNDDLSELSNDNTWGYSYSTNNGTTWSNYSGLPVYTLSGTTLKESTSASNDTVNFKIAAKASADQAAGDYSNIINFTAITNKAPVSFYDAYKANNKTMYNGYYTMQDMSTSICETVDVIGEDSQTKLIDIRDNNTYWVAKLVDGNCWMTQNLNFAPDPNVTYTYLDTDLGRNLNDSTIDTTVTWTPDPETMSEPAKITNFAPDSPENSVTGWVDDYYKPHYAEGKYYNTSTESFTDDEIIAYNTNGYYGDKFTGISDCVVNGNHTITECEHYQIGNYYNWSASVASNNTSTIKAKYEVAPNSVCPAGWRLPNGLTKPDDTVIQSEFNALFLAANITNSSDLTGSTNVGYTTNGWSMINSSPYYFVRAGGIYSTILYDLSTNSRYWSNSVDRYNNAAHLFYVASQLQPVNYTGRYYGFSLRCLAR